MVYTCTCCATVVRKVIKNLKGNFTKCFRLNPKLCWFPWTSDYLDGVGFCIPQKPNAPCATESDGVSVNTDSNIFYYRDALFFI